MLTKITPVGSWSRLAENPVSLIKVSSRGLTGYDRQEFLKRASHVFADKLDHIKVAADELPIHVIAVCDYEHFGANRNFDAFSKRACEMYHDTFVKEGRHYELHNNRDPAKSFGDVRASHYNEPMGRIELLVIGNKTKEAALRNGGLVLASDVIDKIERGEDVPWSMACKVAYDVCSNCGNKAPSRDEYCTAETCINPDTGRKMAGCKDGLGKMAEDGFLQYVDNPHPAWFDISRVRRPAEPEAYGWKADYMSKAASAAMGGAELAEYYDNMNGFELMQNASPADRMLARQMKIARQLADIEAEMLVEGLDARDQAIALAFATPVQPVIDLCQLDNIGTSKQASALAALSMNNVTLSFTDFVRLLHGASNEPHVKEAAEKITKKAARDVPGAFTALANDPNLSNLLRTNIFVPADKYPSGSERQWALKLAFSRSLSPAAVRFRSEHATILGARPQLLLGSMAKVGSAEPTSKLAQHYALYKVAAIAAMPETNDKYEQLLTLRAAVLQNLSVG